MSNFNPSNEDFEELKMILGDSEDVLAHIIPTDGYRYRNLLEQLESACESLEGTVNDIKEEFEKLKEAFGDLDDKFVDLKEANK